MLVLGIIVAAQLAGVSRNSSRPPSSLVFDGVHETWMVKAPGRSASSRLSKATARLGGGSKSPELDGGWYEVQLGDAVPASEAEAAFGAAGAVDVEPVLPRLPYESPQAFDDPAPAGRGSLPGSHDDPPGAVGAGASLRNGPVAAPRIAEQWALSQASDQDIDAPEAWQTTTGAGAIVAVIDTGVEAAHPDLVGRVLPGRDFGGAGTPATVDKVGHGTHVASIIAGNGTSIAGVAPDAQILPLKVFSDSATGFSMSGYLAAIRYAADQGVDAINISLGCGGSTSCFSQAELDALTYAASRGVVIVAAAGNGDRAGNGMNNDGVETPDFPSGYEIPGLIAVTSSTRFGDWSTWSNYGRTGVDLAAPGEGLLVAARLGSYRSVTGTSFSAPLVAGTVALLAARDQAATVDDLKSRILTSVTPSASLVSRSVSGGVLNANAALFAVGSADVTAGGAGAGAVVTSPTTKSPRPGARVGTPPMLAWQLPTGWSSYQLRLAGMGTSFNRKLPGSSRAASHPTGAWRSGTYRWSIVARSPDGTLVTSNPRTYRMLPRMGAWVTSGKVRSGGRVARLRVGYASSEMRADVRVRVKVGRRVIHNGRVRRHTTHTRGIGSPRRAWFGYNAKLDRTLRRGQRIVVEVRVSSGGRTLVRSFRATVR
jgi:subtilisin family serine protease